MRPGGFGGGTGLFGQTPGLGATGTGAAAAGGGGLFNQTTPGQLRAATAQIGGLGGGGVGIFGGAGSGGVFCLLYACVIVSVCCVCVCVQVLEDWDLQQHNLV